MIRRWLEERRLGLPSRAQARAGARAVAIDPHTALARVLDRYKLYVDTRDLSLAPHLMLDGQWELWVTRALAGLLRPGMIAADVGANFGYFSLLMADRVGPAGHVHAFEPQARLVELLGRSIVANGYRGRVTVHQTVLGRTDGEAMKLAMLADEWGSGNLQPLDAPSSPLDVPVETRTMDATPGMDRVELVKIDAEGAEEAIWDGMAGMIAGPALRTAFIEFTACRYADPGGFLDRMTAAGFSLAIVDQRDGVVPIDRAGILALPAYMGPMLVLRR